MSALSKTQLRCTTLGHRIVIARFGADPRLALEQRDAENEFWEALCIFAFEGKKPEPGEGVEISFGSGDNQFICTVQRLALAEAEAKQ